MKIEEPIMNVWIHPSELEDFNEVYLLLQQLWPSDKLD